MIFVRLHNELVELPTANTILEVDGHVSLMDEAGFVVARFDKLDVIAYSSDREKLSLEDVEAQGRVLESSDIHRDGHAN